MTVAPRIKSKQLIDEPWLAFLNIDLERMQQ
jgi:hypothetical protein